MDIAIRVYCLSLSGVLTAGNVLYPRDVKGLEQKVWQQEWRKALERYNGVPTKHGVGMAITGVF